MIGKGKYDSEATELRKRVKADAIIVIIINGEKGHGFSCQLPLEIAPKMPLVLRMVADQIEADVKGATN